MGDVTTMLIAGVPVVGLVIGLTWVCKTYTYVPDRGLPVIAMGLGVIFSVLAWLSQVWPPIKGPVDAVVTGLAIGLVAMGTYSGYKQLPLDKLLPGKGPQ